MDPRFYKHSAPLGLRLLSSEILFLRITTREKLAENRKYFRTQQETDWNRPQTFRPLGLRLLSSETFRPENRKYFSWGCVCCHLKFFFSELRPVKNSQKIENTSGLSRKQTGIVQILEIIVNLKHVNTIGSDTPPLLARLPTLANYLVPLYCRFHYKMLLEEVGVR